MSKFYIIVPVFQTSGILKIFLESLKQTVTYETDICFVNDGSGYSIQKMLETFHFSNAKGHVTVLENTISQGSVKAINQAMQHVSDDCQYLVFLDSDIILQGNWQEELLNTFKSDDIGAAGGMLLYPQSGGIQCCGLTYCGTSGKHLYLNADPDKLQLINPYDVQATIFAFCCVRKEVADTTGLLDENFFNGYEDLDYQFRIRKLGYKIVINPNIKLYHWEKSNGNHREYNRKSNLGRFWQKHGVCIKDDLTCFIGKQLDRRSFFEKGYTGYDFCEERTAALRIRKWLDETASLKISNWNDVSYMCHSHDTIWLPELMNSGNIFNPGPFLFLCDHMIQLLDNQYWWSLRQKVCRQDLIIDLYGNVILFGELSTSFWPGRKIR